MLSPATIFSTGFGINSLQGVDVLFGRYDEQFDIGASSPSKMTEFRTQYKKRTLGFGNNEESRILRAEKHAENRKLLRADNYSIRRDIVESPVIRGDVHNERETKDAETSALEDRRQKLMKWKAERELKKKLEEKKKKPVFKTGVVSHSWNSPVFKSTTTASTKPCRSIKPQNTPQPRITRATQKRLAAKLAAVKSSIAPVPKKSSKKTNKSANIEPPTTRPEISFAPKDHLFKAPSGLTTVPLFGMAAIRHNKLEEQEEEEEEQDLKTSEGKENIDQPNASPPKIFVTEIKEKSPLVEDSIAEVPDDQDSCETLNSSIENFTLRLSPEQLEKLDCPERKKTTPTREAKDLEEAPVYSPYVVSSRGKHNARREQATRLGIGRSPSEEIPTKATVMQNLNISIEEEERTAQYFRFILDREVERLSRKCSDWEEIKSAPDLPEEAAYTIHQAIGQTRLLMSKKIERFRGLVSDCETGKGLMLVTCRDLQGFWDMIVMEIEDCDARFRKLEALRSKNWAEEEQQPEVVKKEAKKKTVTKKKVIPGKASAVRAMIQAARRKQMQQKSESDEKLAEKKSESPKRFVAAKNKVSTPGSVKKKRLSLLQQVQMSEGRKSVVSPLAVMKISKMCKTPEVKSDDSIIYVNSDQTPGRGILKRLEEGSACSQKTSHKVNFNDDVDRAEVPMDEDKQALKRIDSYDLEECFDDEINVRAEKKLTFSDDSFEEMEIEAEENVAAKAALSDEQNVTLGYKSATEEAKVTRMKKNEGTEILSATKRSTSRRRSDKKQNIVEDDEEKEKEIKTPRRSTRNSMKNAAQNDSKASEISRKTPGARRKSSKTDTDKKPTADDTKRRRSSRKSVRFTGEDCTACAESKPVHPMTPHTRRSASRTSVKRTETLSFLGETSVESAEPLESGDLISWNSPAKLPSRVRRSLRNAK